MIDGEGNGRNWQGLHGPEATEYYGNRWCQDGSEFSETVNLVLLARRCAIDRKNGKHYPMARNVLPQLRAAYGEALSRYNVLVMHADLGARPAGSRCFARGRSRSGARDAGEDLAPRRQRPPRLQRAGALINGLPTDMIDTGGSTTPRCCASRMARTSGRFVPDDGDGVDGTRQVTFRSPALAIRR